MSSSLSDYRYDLPGELIADRPTTDRTGSRMMVIDRQAASITHSTFAALPSYIHPGDLLILNDSKVIPARLYDESGGIEMLLLEEQSPTRWTAMVRPGKKMRAGTTVRTAGTSVTVKSVLDDGTRLLEFASPPNLEAHGSMPIPPYFRRKADEHDRERYQTVFARDRGSVAAPTAGLHFSREILDSIPHAFVTLHVGAGTFQPVKTEDLSQHRMHHERFFLPEETAASINSARKVGGRVIAVGTTSLRVLESCQDGSLQPLVGSTDIFIRPPFDFRHVDALLTNFHLPESTLLMLVSAFAGRTLIMEAYQEAIRERYRFFSYGDCMLIA
jgi:S-adenosylmethionine:tRNA ribosyltransferase-isomerase